MTSLRDVVLPDVKTPLTPLKHSMQSKRLPADPGGSATLDDRGWLTYRGQTWRMVYDVDDYAREVYILAIGKHDEAYDDAERRRYR